MEGIGKAETGALMAWKFVLSYVVIARNQEAIACERSPPHPRTWCTKNVRP